MHTVQSPSPSSYQGVRSLLPLCIPFPLDLRCVSQVLIAQTHTHPLSAVDSLLDGLFVGNLAHIGIVLDLKLAPEMLGSDKLEIPCQLLRSHQRGTLIWYNDEDLQ